MPPSEVFDHLYNRASDNTYIAISARDDDGQIRPLAPLPIRKYQPYLPGILESLLNKTKYFGVNPMKEKGLVAKGGIRTYLEALPNILRGERKPLYHRYTLHKPNNIAEFSAVVADLDVGREGSSMTSHGAIFGVYDKAVRGLLPFPSMAAHSGRGAYVLWLLQDHRDNETLPEMSDRHLQIWKAVTLEIFRRTRDLESDATAATATKLLKMPDTIDTKTGKFVRYISFYSSQGPYVYSLPELIKMFRLHIPEISTASARARTRHVERINKGKTRASAPYRKRCNEITDLAQYRGGLGEGVRDLSLFHYFSSAWTWQKMEFPHTDAIRTARDMAYDFNQKLCTPPLTALEMKYITKGQVPKGGKQASGSRIAADLKVTEEEVKALGLTAIAPAELKKTEREEQAIRGRYQRKISAAVEAKVKAGHTNKQIREEMKKEFGYEPSRQYLCNHRARAEGRAWAKTKKKK